MAEQEEKKLNWMYKGLSGHVDKEEYLTGRKIDKTFELIRNEEAIGKGDLEVDGDVVPHSVLAMASNGSTITVDMAAKVREDPLFDIRKKEFEKRREILDNPLKVKRIKDMLKRTLASSSSSDDSSDDEHKHKKGRHKSKKTHRHRRRSPSDRRKTKRSSSRDDRKRKRSHSPRKQVSRRDRGHYQSRDSRRDRSTSRDRKRSGDSRKDSRRDHKVKPVSVSETNSKPDRSPPRSTNSSRKPPPPKFKPAERPKLSAEELEKKRLEMMGDADRREKERADKVRLYKELEAKEKDESISGKPAGFIKEQMSRAANEASLESTLKQKSFKAQGNRSMDTNFARR